MFKIENQANKLYTVKCYFYNKNEHQNVELYSVTNLDEIGVARLLQGRNDKELDVAFAMDVLRLANCPAFFSDTGELTAVPVIRRDV